MKLEITFHDCCHRSKNKGCQRLESCLKQTELYTVNKSLIIVKLCPQADRRPELKRLISRVKRDQELERAHHGNSNEECAVKRFKLPKKYMQLEEFVRCVQESGIVKDQGTIQRLFDALTVGKYCTYICTCLCIHYIIIIQ